jgi:hypothetical protein
MLIMALLNNTLFTFLSCLGRFFKIFLGRRAWRSWLSHLLTTTGFDAFLLSVNVCVQSRFSSHVSFPSSQLRLPVVDMILCE